MASIGDYLRHLVDRGGSDVHLKAGGPAFIRVAGELEEVAELPALEAEDTARFAEQVMEQSAIDRVVRGGEADFAVSVRGVGRFRAAVFRQRGAIGMVLRAVQPETVDIPSLGLPPAVRAMAEEQRGLVLVTGPTGSGKTTTTAAMLGHINSTRRCHIVTIEDPIEILHEDRQALIDQREVGIDTDTFATALRAVSRQDPDVIFIGEMRDLETVGAALQAAETGHLVLSTLHTNDATETVNRIIDLHPPHQQHQARLALANVLRGVVSQRLLPGQREGRVPAVETLVTTTRVREFLIDADKTDQIPDAIAEGSYYGMQTFDQHLLELYREGRVALRDAMRASTSPHDFRIAVRAAGLAA